MYKVLRRIRDLIRVQAGLRAGTVRVMAEAMSSYDAREIGAFDVPQYHGLEPRCPFTCRFLFASKPVPTGGTGTGRGDSRSIAGDWIGLFPCGWRSLNNAIQRRAVSSDSRRTNSDPSLVKLQFCAPNDQRSDRWYQFMYVSGAGDVLAKSDAVNFGSDPGESPCPSQPSSYMAGTGPELGQFPYALLQGIPLDTSPDLTDEAYLPGFDGLIERIDRAQIRMRTSVLSVKMFVEERFGAQEEEIKRLRGLLEDSEETKREMSKEMNRLQCEVTRLQRALDAVRGYIPEEDNRNITRRQDSSFMSTGEYSIPSYDHSTDPLLRSHYSDVAMSGQPQCGTDIADKLSLIPSLDTEIAHSDVGQSAHLEAEHPQHGLEDLEQQKKPSENGSASRDPRDAFLKGPSHKPKNLTSSTSCTVPATERDTNCSSPHELSLDGRTLLSGDSSKINYSGVAPMDGVVTGSGTSHITEENLVVSGQRHLLTTTKALQSEVETGGKADRNNITDKINAWSDDAV